MTCYAVYVLRSSERHTLSAVTGDESSMKEVGSRF